MNDEKFIMIGLIIVILLAGSIFGIRILLTQATKNLNENNFEETYTQESNNKNTENSVEFENTRTMLNEYDEVYDNVINNE